MSQERTRLARILLTTVQNDEDRIFVPDGIDGDCLSGWKKCRNLKLFIIRECPLHLLSMKAKPFDKLFR